MTFRTLITLTMLLAFNTYTIYIPKNKPRPSSNPHISGDTFRSISQHIIDETYQKFDPKNVQPGDVVFVQFEFMKQFFHEHHSRISNSYILITHNEDMSAPKQFIQYLDDPKIIAWLTQNCDLDAHYKLIPIPIGLSNKHWNHSCNHDQLINKINQRKTTNKPTKVNLLYLNFSINTNSSIRRPIYNFFSKQPYCTTATKGSQDNFYHQLAQSKFTISPHGNGLDCHRTWEALLLGCFPIVKASTLDELYKDLPVLIVQDWSEVTEEFLHKKYEEMCAQSYNMDKLYFPYWHEFINEIKEKYNPNN